MDKASEHKPSLRDVLDEILDLIESVSEGFPTYSYNNKVHNSYWLGWLFWVSRPFETVFQSISQREGERRENLKKGEKCPDIPARP